MNDLKNRLGDLLGGLRERIPSDVNLSLVLPVVVMVVALLGDIVFARATILPHWQARNELAAKLIEVEQQLLEAQQAQQKGPDDLQAELQAAQAELEKTARRFFSESQAAEILDGLYRYADESNVEIVNLQSQSAPAEESAGEEQPAEEEGSAEGSEAEQTQDQKKALYDVKTFRLEVTGSVPNLIGFLSRIKEASLKTFKISNVNIVEGEEFQHVLTMDVTLYTSPYSAGAAGEIPSDVLPTVTPMDLTQLENALAVAWEAEDWNQAITAINQILAVDPGYEGMVDKLYQAHVNYGYQFLEAGNQSEAIAQFSRALEIKPGGEEATAGLQLASAAPTPTLTARQQLEQRLDEEWTAQNWEEVIRIVEEILAISPGDSVMTEKLYSAHVNHAYKLIEQGKLEEAKQEFSAALAVDPDGAAAIQGLQQLAGGTSTPAPTSGPQYISYVVRQGDTLFSVARRYGVTVEAIMTANGLTSYSIYAGQQLRIPIP